ncbi:MAG: MTAP family purine nucleoside phosphorylase, partial [Chloroflexota bacterium]
MTDHAEIGVFGGSGFYSLLEDVREVKVDTPYGPPSDSLFLASVAGRSVAFLPRHGRRHTIPPHRINYRANVWAMRSLGVKAVIAPCAAGSLQLHVKPGDFVVCDQFVDRTRSRPNTFYDGPIVTHLSSAE